MNRKLIIPTLTLILLLIAGCSSRPVTTLTNDRYIGSKASDKYHYVDCKWALNIKASNAVWFTTPSEAKNKGYKPCQTCNPPS